MLCWMTGWLLCYHWINVWLSHYMNEYDYSICSLFIYLSRIKKGWIIAWYWSTVHTSNPPSWYLLETLVQIQGTKTPSCINCKNVVLAVTHRREISQVRWHLRRRCFQLNSTLSGRYLGLCCAGKKGLNLGLGPWREGQEDTRNPTNGYIFGTLNHCG